MTERRDTELGDLKSRRLPGAGLPHSAACEQWEMLLADALDEQLRTEDEETFSSHMAGCSACAALFEEARRGREWLSFLSVEPEVPEGLLERILASTGPGQNAGHSVQIGGAAAVPVPIVDGWPQQALMNPASMSPVSMSPGFISYARRASATRMMMTAAMAFFSVALMLNLGGVRLAHLSLNAMRPTVVRANLERRLATASVPVERYYDHLRVVHEVESSVRVLRNNINGESPDEKQRLSQPGGPGVSGGAGAVEHNKDSVAHAPAVDEPWQVTPRPEDQFALDTRKGSSIWTA